MKLLQCTHSSLNLLVLLRIHSVFLVIRLHSFQHIFLQFLRWWKWVSIEILFAVEYQEIEIAGNFTKDTCHCGGVQVNDTQLLELSADFLISVMSLNLSFSVEFSVILK